MRKTLTGMAALIATAALLTGCGSSGGGGDKGSAKSDATAKSSVEPKADAGDKEVTHEVTFEVQGTGKTQVYYDLDTNKGEEVSLPWQKTAKVSVVGAEHRVGHLVTLAPGSTQGDDGMLRAASCVIKVDGKKVADNQDGKSGKPCEYKLK